MKPAVLCPSTGNPQTLLRDGLKSQGCIAGSSISTFFINMHHK